MLSQDRADRGNIAFLVLIPNYQSPLPSAMSLPRCPGMATENSASTIAKAIKTVRSDPNSRFKNGLVL